MAASPDNPEDFATKGDWEILKHDLRNDLHALSASVDVRFASVDASFNVTHADIAALARMLGLVMDHLGISEPLPGHGS